jgi:hypothetical protein
MTKWRQRYWGLIRCSVWYWHYRRQERARTHHWLREQAVKPATTVLPCAGFVRV